MQFLFRMIKLRWLKVCWNGDNLLKWKRGEKGGKANLYGN